METFRTILKPVKEDWHIDHFCNIGMIGSCFTEHIGQLLRDFYFKTWINPRGILFNPWSIADLLENKAREDADIGFYNGIWYSLNHHGSFSSEDKHELLERLVKEQKRTFDNIKQSSILIITFGTANVFRLKKSNKIVANCHKLPSDNFERIRLTISQITDRLSDVLEQLLQSNPNLKIVLTLSPVRHIRDGIIENQRSKATLLLAVENLTKLHSNISYFPAFELLMDDLRDYRFYSPDMIHPSETAVKYIWNFFKKTYFDKETLSILDTINRLKQQLQHKPIHPTSMQHQIFQKKLAKEIELFKQNHPHIQWS